MSTQVPGYDPLPLDDFEPLLLSTKEHFDIYWPATMTGGLDDDAFGAGLVVPALPLVESRGIGISELTRYFKKATRL